MNTYVVTHHTAQVPSYLGFWRGPSHMWGKTFGSYDQTPIYSSRAAAENALRKVYPSVAAAARGGVKVQTVKAATEFLQTIVAAQ